MALVGDRTPAVWSLCATFCHTSTWSASWTPCCRTDRVTMGPARLREEGLRRGHRPQAPPPPPLLHTGHGDLQFGPGGHQDGGVEDAVLPGAHQLLAVDQQHGP